MNELEKDYFSDLKEYGKGYSVQNLKYMSQIANEFRYDEIMHQHGAQISWRSLIEIIQQPVGQIPWGTIIVIMQKSKAHEEMLFYMKETHKNGCYRN